MGEGVERFSVPADREAAPGRHQNALRLAGYRPGPPRQPADAVRGPKHTVQRGKTPVLASEEMRDLLESVPSCVPMMENEIWQYLPLVSFVPFCPVPLLPHRFYFEVSK